MEQPLEDKCKNLLSTVKLKDQELQPLKKDAIPTNESIDALQEARIFHEESNGAKEEQIFALEEEINTT